MIIMNMPIWLVFGLIIVAVAIMVIVAVRVLLKKKSRDLSACIETIVPFYRAYKKGEGSFGEGDVFFIGIEDDLERSFYGHFISSSEKDLFVAYYDEFFHEVSRFFVWLEKFNVKPTETIEGFACDCENIHLYIKKHNDQVIQNLLDVNKFFFDTCLKYPLDKQQRRSIVSEEDNCLVVSSAGSGKTSSIVGKVKYLIDIKKVNPQNILLISYTNKAAAELTERMGIEGLRGYTFHKLGIDIIGKTTGQKPMICDNTDSLFMSIYHELLNDEKFSKSIVEYVIDYQDWETEDERLKDARKQRLSEQKNIRLKALFPDMDGNTIYVRSEQERKICFVLSSLGVKFRYEEPYEYSLTDDMHSQYKPDFSIYFEKDNKIKRIYLEHFGVDEHGLVPIWFAKDRGMTYEDANKKYSDGITWKKAVHEKFGTTLLVTSSADFHFFDIRDKIKILLEKVGVSIVEKTDAELYASVLPANSKQEKAFIRLVATFITLMKSSCKKVDVILQQAECAEDERSVFIIKNIFQPVYKRYVAELKESGRIDFTDVILQATDICRSLHPVKFDYIIVDEFQDISVDRYNFLKVLRDGEPPAKLYCVGDDWQSIYRFSGSDMALFNQFPDYFGHTEINKIETTYRFGEPLVSLSSKFIQRNSVQIRKKINSFNPQLKTDLQFCDYEVRNYCDVIGKIVASIPFNKTVFLLGRYSFDDYNLSFGYKSIREGNRFYYFIGDRKIEFLTVHKSKGLEADYVIILQCNKGTYGFPSLVSDNRVLDYVLTKSDKYPYGEERRLFYVAITRAKVKTVVLYDRRFPSVFVDEFLHPEKITEESYLKNPNANKRWTRKADKYLLDLYHEGKSIKYIAGKMGRSQTAIVMRLGKLKRK